MPTFTELMAGAAPGPDALRLTITDDWMQGRTTFGGLSAAFSLEAAQRAHPDLPALRGATVAFVGPAGGELEGRVDVLRRGRSVSFVGVDVLGDKGLAARSTFAFGDPRVSALDATWSPPPGAPAPEACEAFLPPGFGPAFTQHIETRLVKGGRPASGVNDHDLLVWVRHRDEAAAGVGALIAIADMLPAPVLAMAREFAPISSVTWSFSVLDEAPRTRDGWWLCRSTADHAAHGYSSQDMLVWNRDLELVIAGRQTMAVFF